MAKFRINQIHISILKPVFSRPPLLGSFFPSSSSFVLGAIFSIGLALPATALANNSACVDSIRNQVAFTDVYKGANTLEVRIAAAEFLATHALDSNGGTTISDGKAAALLQAIADNSLSEAQAELLPQYDTLLRNIVQSSKAVERQRIAVSYSDKSAPESISQILSVVTSPTRPNVFTRLFGGNKAADLQFLNAEQFGNALEAFPENQRLDQLRRASSSFPLLTYLEAFHILLTLPKSAQPEADRLLSSRIFGRLDMFPQDVLEESAAHLDGSVLAHHVQKSGGRFPLATILKHLRKNGMSDLQIIEAIPMEALTVNAIENEILAKTSLNMPEALFWLHLTAKTTPTPTEVERYVYMIAERLNDPDVKYVLNDYGKQIIRHLDDSQVKATFNQAAKDLSLAPSGDIPFKRQPNFDTRRILYVAMSAHSPSDALFGFRYAGAMKNFNYIRETTSWEYGPFEAPDRRARALLKDMEKKFFEELGVYTNASWSLKDLEAMGISDDTPVLAGIALMRVAGQSASLIEVYEMRTQIIRILSRPGTRELPQLAGRPIDERSGVSLKALRSFLLSLLNRIEIKGEW